MSIAAASAVLGGSLVGLGASGAGAAETAGACDYIMVVKNNSNGYGYFKGPTPLRKLPEARCGSHGTYRDNTKFYFWCYTTNRHGNNWIFGRIAGTEETGWVYEKNISWNDGRLKHCRES
ncbi:hypothetical protein [Embleya sp. NPDC050493]|uniref:hypothetical protein n=1 Tax=Embleya sp. NPDC050493 TaxID=3363989 RepID=UPI003789A9C0